MRGKEWNKKRGVRSYWNNDLFVALDVLLTKGYDQYWGRK